METPDTRHARIPAQLARGFPLGAGFRVGPEQLRKPVLGVRHHGAELQAAEGAAGAADAGMAEERRPAIGADQQNDERADRQQQNKKGHGAQDVDRALGSRPHHV